MRADARSVVALALSFSLSSCAVNLSSEGEPPQPARVVPQLSGCLPLADRASAVTGRVSWVTLPDRSSLVVADSATLGGETSSVGFANAASDCLAQSEPLATRPIIDITPVSTTSRARPLGSLTITDTFLYFSADHADGLGSDGIGVARWDAASERFTAQALLWTADRPSYGSAAALVGDEVYVFGGLDARFLSADVYLARVPSAQIADLSAYEYWQGGGNFGPDADLAQPLVEGGQSPSVAWSATEQRWLMLYATPLASELTVRSGLDISGPWSAPYTLGRCDLPSSDPGAFCGDSALVPELAADGQIALTQGVASFARPPAATDQDFWTRLVRVPWPSGLP